MPSLSVYGELRQAIADSWFTRCDGKLFLPPKADKTKAVLLPVLAIKESVMELLDAWKNKKLPSGLYSATKYVAFPDSKAPALVDKFPTNASDEWINELVQCVAWYSQIPWVSKIDNQNH